MAKRSSEEQALRWVQDNFLPLLTITIILLVLAAMITSSGDLTGLVTKVFEQESKGSDCRIYDIARNRCVEYVNGTETLFDEES